MTPEQIEEIVAEYILGKLKEIQGRSQAYHSIEVRACGFKDVKSVRYVCYSELGGHHEKTSMAEAVESFQIFNKQVDPVKTRREKAAALLAEADAMEAQEVS